MITSINVIEVKDNYATLNVHYYNGYKTLKFKHCLKLRLDKRNNKHYVRIRKRNLYDVKIEV